MAGAGDLGLLREAADGARELDGGGGSAEAGGLRPSRRLSRPTKVTAAHAVLVRDVCLTLADECLRVPSSRLPISAVGAFQAAAGVLGVSPRAACGDAAGPVQEAATRLMFTERPEYADKATREAAETLARRASIAVSAFDRVIDSLPQPAVANLAAALADLRADEGAPEGLRGKAAEAEKALAGPGEARAALSRARPRTLALQGVRAEPETVAGDAAPARLYSAADADERVSMEGATEATVLRVPGAGNRALLVRKRVKKRGLRDVRVAPMALPENTPPEHERVVFGWATALARNPRYSEAGKKEVLQQLVDTLIQVRDDPSLDFAELFRMQGITDATTADKLDLVAERKYARVERDAVQRSPVSDGAGKVEYYDEEYHDFGDYEDDE